MHPFCWNLPGRQKQLETNSFPDIQVLRWTGLADVAKKKSFTADSLSTSDAKTILMVRNIMKIAHLLHTLYYRKPFPPQYTQEINSNRCIQTGKGQKHLSKSLPENQ